jgi:agmatine deiminase
LGRRPAPRRAVQLHNRNPGLGKAAFEAELKRVLGLDPDPQSYDHEVTKAHLQILRNARDAQGRKLQVVVMQAPDTFSQQYDASTFAAGYIGFYVCNGAVISQKFGDARADAAARQQLQQAFPGRVVEQLRMDAIAAGGGSVHCATQQEPLFLSAK